MKKSLLFLSLLVMMAVSVVLCLNSTVKATNWTLVVIPLMFTVGYIWGTTNFKTGD